MSAWLVGIVTKAVQPADDSRARRLFQIATSVLAGNL
jgi:hypothetical protein